MEQLEDDKNHFEHVDIEVSCYEEYTSEEEFESTKFAKIGKQSTLGRSYFGKSAVVGQTSNAGASITLSKSKKKRND